MDKLNFDEMALINKEDFYFTQIETFLDVDKDKIWVVIDRCGEYGVAEPVELNTINLYNGFCDVVKYKHLVDFASQSNLTKKDIDNAYKRMECPQKKFLELLKNEYFD